MTFFTDRISVAFTEEQFKGIDAQLRANPEIYKDRAEFVRGCVIRVLRKLQDEAILHGGKKE
jgi:Arc/MetJ-type ribon-helix-helix transcriptional regulator